MYSFLNLEPVHCSMSGSNCCFLTHRQVSQETGKVVWYLHLFKNLPVCHNPHSQRLSHRKNYRAPIFYLINDGASNYYGMVAVYMGCRSEVKWSESSSVVSDSLRLHGLYNPWNSPGQNTEVSCCSLLQGIFPTQGLNPGLLHCRWIFYCLSHQGSHCRSEPSHNNRHPHPGGKCLVLLHTPLAWCCSSEASFLPLGSEFTCSKVISKNIYAGRREVVGALYLARNGCISSTLVSGLGVSFQKLPIWIHSKTYGLACCSIFKSLINKYNGRCLPVVLNSGCLIESSGELKILRIL